ncbi:MAG: hypothetical protein WCH65_01665 [bacterium]
MNISIYFLIGSFVAVILITILGTGKRAIGFGGIISDTKLVMRLITYEFIIFYVSLFAIIVLLIIGP